jgi:Bacterial PH domain
MDEPGTRTFYRAPARRYGYPVLIFGLIWAFCGIYAGLLAPVVWSGTNAFVAEPVGLVVTASAVWVLVVGVRFLRIALIASPSGVRVRGPLHDHTLSWEQIRGFEQGRVSGWTFAGADNPVVVVAPVSGKPIVVHALRVDRGTKGDAPAMREVEQLCAEIEAIRPTPRAKAVPSLSAG